MGTLAVMDVRIERSVDANLLRVGEDLRVAGSADLGRPSAMGMVREA